MGPVEREQILQYARHHNLFGVRTDKSLIDVPTGFWHPFELSKSLADPEGFPNVEGLAYHEELERLDLSVEARALLHTALVVDAAEKQIDWWAHETHRLQQFKLELPLLKTDHDLDVRRFRKGAAIVDLDHGFPSPMAIEEANDEGLSWPSKFQDLPESYVVKSNNEKLDITRSSLECLKDLMAPEDSVTSLEEALDLQCKYKKTRNLDPLTPPLSPLMRPNQYGPWDSARISSPILDFGNLPLTTSSTSEELNNLNRKLLEQDQLSIASAGSFTGRHRSGDVGGVLHMDSSSSPVKWGTETQSSSPPARVKPRDLKFDDILSPASLSKDVKAVSFSDSPEDISAFAPQKCTKSDDDHDEVDSDQAYEDLFNTIIEAKALQADHNVDNEQLEEAGIDIQLQIPTIDLARPVAPWTTVDKDPKLTEGIRDLTVPIAKLSLHRWPGLRKYDAGPSGLPWSPFPMRLAEVAEFESLHRAEQLGKLLDCAGYDSAIALSDLTWKPEGLRILDDFDDDDLEPVQLDQSTGLSSLLRKRKQDLQDVEVEPSSQSQFRNANAALPENSAAVVLTEAGERQPTTIPTERTSMLMKSVEPAQATTVQDTGSTFDTQDSLSRFMQLQGHISKKPCLAKAPALPAAMQIAPSSPFKPLSSEELLSQPIVSKPFPAPSLLQPLGNRNLVIGSELTQTNRFLIRHLTALAPTLDFIERDWGARVDPTAQRTSRLGKSNTKLTCEHDEGDIIISPSTGLIITTLQKIKQKTLPGQGSESNLRQRIRIVAARFERLVVLVSLGHRGAAMLDAVDCAAITLLTNFCAGLEDDVSVYSVGGDDEDMARWIVGLVGQTEYGKDVKLLGDETLWEVFLRRAGANVFAAQEILAGLKRPEDNAVDFQEYQSSIGECVSETCFGLSAFVAMDASARVQLFERALGGTKLLDRISRLVDARWMMVQKKPTQDSSNQL